TVTYHADGGTPTPANWTGTQYTNSYNISGTVNPSMTLAAAITKAGFIFDGWVSSASGTKHAAGATVSPYTNTTMKAAWVDQPVTQYAVSYNATENGGTTTATTAQLASGAAVPLTPTATKSGWTFIGWNTNKDATTALTSLTVGTSNITVYAIFSKTLTVTLKDYNGAAATTRTVSVTIYNKATTGPVTLPSVNTYTGWTARGWATATAADAGVTVTSGTYTVSADTTLNGLYQRTLTVTYDAAGGTPTPANWTGTQYTNAANIGVTSDPSMTLAAAITKEGFVFDGWNSGSTKYAAGASATITANTTMTASWVEKPLTTFAVTYDAAKNGGTTTAAPAQLATGAAVPLTPTAVKSGWTFVGWNTNKDASSALTSLTMGTSNVTLYAIYSKTLTVTLKDYNGAAAATRTASVTIFNTATSGEVNIPTVNTYTGWTSQGWASATTATASIVVVSGAYSVSADQTLYGTYQRTLTVTYDANGGTSTPPSTPPSTSPSASPSTPASTMAVQYTNSFAITQTMNPTVTLAAGVTKTGSVFDGWVSSATGTKYAAGASLSLTESLTMTASWVTENVTRFQVTYNATENGGSTAVTTAQVATGAAVDLTLPATKSGWTFVGWNTNKDASTAMTSLTMGSANVTLYAIYSKVITATLKDISGTTETTRTVSETIYNKATAALLKIPATNTYTGWTSRGWALTTSPEAPVALVSGNQTVTDNVTLYGVYLRMLTVTFNANGGRTTPIMQITVQYVNGASVSTPSYPSITLPTGDIRTGYTFDGWVSSVSGTKSPAGSVVSIGANTLFTASWASTTATKYTVTYNYAENGGVFGSLTSDQVTQGALVNLAPVAAKTDWIFLGWNTNKDATTALTSFSMPESNVTLYAIYSRTITVTLKDYSGTEAASRTVSATIFNKATSSSVTLPTVNTFSGWTARGWGMPTGPNPAVVAISGAYTVTENLTLYGLYQRTLTVKYDAAGGTPTPANLTAAQYTSSAAVNSPSTVSFALPAAITRQDFTFDGWVNTTTGTKSAALASVTLNADTTFAAAWVGVKEVTGKVTYNFAENGGVSATITTADATAGEPVKLDSVASKPGWVFVGWNTDKNATTAVSALLMPATDLTLYAIYSKTLTVTLKDYSGLAAATRTVTATLMNKATSGTAMLPTVNEYSGWTSRGWTTGTNANATVLVTSGAYSITADVTLYGLYERKVTATFDPNGGSPAPAQQSATSYMNSYAANSPTAVAFTLPAAITQTGFTFAGWQSSSSGSIIAAGLLVSTTTNTTFKALWSVSGATPRLRTVTYDCTTNGGLITTLWTAQVASGGPVNLSPLAYKPGYNFAGWNTDKNAKTGLSSFTMPDSDVTLYAIFN
ncbi:MAG: InlB B-repeat-containing protein, partial [Propionibacteriaceae bacterium]|nr:InlB B-repeat-containing protein [Propionibacteriaceae bacterium]